MNKNPTNAMMSRLAQPFSMVVVIFLLIVAGGVTQQNIWMLWKNTSLVESTYDFLNVVDSLESTLKDAETGQRGYVISGNFSYLAPYQSAESALDLLMDQLVDRTGDRDEERELIDQLEVNVARKRLQLKRVLSAYETDGFDAAKEIINTNVGKEAMDDVRTTVQQIRGIQTTRLTQLRKETQQTYRVAWYMGLFTTIVGIVLVGGVLRSLHRRRVAAEQDAAVIREERERLKKAVDDRQLFERRSLQLDKHIRLFVDQIQDYAIFTMDTEFHATSWNMGVSKVLGFEESEFIGSDIRPLIFTPEANASGVTSNEFKMAAERGTASDDRWMMRKGQTRFWAAGITSSIRDEHGQLIGYSKVMRDMTIEKQSGDELSRLASELSEESRRKNDFLATLAHELRNPLSPIKNAVQLMDMMPLNMEVSELRITMARQVDQLVRLIDDLTDISRIGRGKLDLRKEFVRIDTIVNAAIEASRPLIESNLQQLEVQIGACEMMVEVDPARIIQVVCNLLNNASKYSGANRKITIVAMLQNGNVEIRVKDNGNGIAVDRLESIFDMYCQLEESVERGLSGLGIGLSLVRKLVELHGGTVTAHSEGEGQGSEFIVRIPVASHAAKSETKVVATSLDAPEQFYRILIVEDMPALAMVMARLLTKMGHHVAMVESGEAAIEKLKSFDAEVIFSDISMPMMTGYELARYLRSNQTTSKLRLVAMTGYGSLSDREKAIAAGFDEHMTKPVDIDRLREFFNGLSAPQ